MNTPEKQQLSNMRIILNHDEAKTSLKLDEISVTVDFRFITAFFVEKQMKIPS